MALPKTEKKFSDKDSVEQAIDRYSALQAPTQSDLYTVKTTAQIKRGLDEYRAAAMNMSVDELEDERHQSSLLSHFMGTAGKPKPHPKCQAHAIVSGAHQYAAELRAVIAWLKLRIDDPDNGCWLPENTAAKAHMPKGLRNAVPHSRIHRYNYYFWLNTLIEPSITSTQGRLRDTLK